MTDVSSINGTDTNGILQSYIASQKEAATNAAATAKASTATSISSVTGNFNTFLKILTTQLKNQDPTAATDPNQYTQELVQFSGIEQQINTNSKLDQLISAANPNGITPLLGYVGKTIEASANDQIVVQSGTANCSYTLAGAAQNVTLSVVNSAGKTVASMSGSVLNGVNRIAWNGKQSDGTIAPDGVYTLKVDAKDATGKPVKVSNIDLIGAVTGIQTESDGTTTVTIGGVHVKASDIKNVYAGITAQPAPAATGA